MNRYTKFLLMVLMLGCPARGSSAAENRPMRVVATLSTFADLAKTVGGDQVEVAAIASPKFNPHFIEPKPSDVLKVKRAELFIHAGLDLEAAWRGPLLDAAANRDVMPGGSRELDLSRGIELLEVPNRPLSRAEGDIHLYGNPHYWLSPENGKKMAQAICDKLCALDPTHEQAYHRRLEEWLSRLDAEEQRWRVRLAPVGTQELVGYHNEWPYLMEFTGLSLRQFLEPKPGIPPTPKQVEQIQQHVAHQRIRAIVQATFEPKEAASTVAKRTGARVVLLCQNVGELPACSDYVAMLDYNVTQLVTAFSD